MLAEEEVKEEEVAEVVEEGVCWHMKCWETVSASFSGETSTYGCSLSSKVFRSDVYVRENDAHVVLFGPICSLSCVPEILYQSGCRDQR